MSEEPTPDLLTRLLLLATIWLMALLVWVKGAAGWEARSLTLLTESLYTLLVGFNGVLSFLAVTNPDHPTGQDIYGHGRRETAIALFLTGTLTLASAGLIWMFVQQVTAALQREVLPFPLQVNPPLLQLVGLSTLSTLALALFSLYHARRLKHPLLGYNATQLFKDASLGILVLLSLWGVWWGEPLFDLLAALILFIVLLDGFWHMICWQLPLMVEQVSIAPDVLAAIAQGVRGVSYCYRIRSRGIVGQFLYLQMHLVIEARYEPQAPLIARQIEEELRLRYGALQVTFYIETERKRGVGNRA
ncbi:cation diffusion facilitator family transporter [Spirulina subsalsa]|uniref:cation diffusion facilitator family transporter n=1 Tax=Spirulina subsalsa TaxID=54311 RepID=UPI00030A0491|nr:cation transporter [Spirulina subsalsa]